MRRVKTDPKIASGGYFSEGDPPWCETVEYFFHAFVAIPRPRVTEWHAHISQTGAHAIVTDLVEDVAMRPRIDQDCSGRIHNACRDLPSMQREIADPAGLPVERVGTTGDL